MGARRSAASAASMDRLTCSFHLREFTIPMLRHRCLAACWSASNRARREVKRIVFRSEAAIANRSRRRRTISLNLQREFEPGFVRRRLPSQCANCLQEHLRLRASRLPPRRARCRLSANPLGDHTRSAFFGFFESAIRPNHPQTRPSAETPLQPSSNPPCEAVALHCTINPPTIPRHPCTCSSTRPNRRPGQTGH